MTKARVGYTDFDSRAVAWRRPGRRPEICRNNRSLEPANCRHCLHHEAVHSFGHRTVCQPLTTRWQTADLLAHVRPRKPRSEQLLDLSPSLALARLEPLS